MSVEFGRLRSSLLALRHDGEARNNVGEGKKEEEGSTLPLPSP